MLDRENVISDIEQQIRWIEEIECHKFPGWLNATNAMRDAIALLKEQESIIESLKSDLHETLEVVSRRLNVIRCKDCKHFCKEEKAMVANQYCNNLHRAVTNDWFCADGERMEGR